MIDADRVNFAFLTHKRGIISRRDTITPVRFVVGHGAIGFPAPITLDSPREHVTLHVPDEGESSVQVHLEIELLTAGPRASLVDRWEAYHGRAGSPRFYVGTAHGAKLGAIVIPGDALTTENPLRAIEPKLIKMINSDPTTKKKLSTITGVGEIGIDAIAVGVDALGIDARTAIGVVRVPFAARALDEASALAMIAALGATP